MSWIILLNCVKGCSGYKGRGGGYYSGVCAFFCLILKHAGQRNRSYTRPDMRHSTPITVMDRYLCTVPILDTGTRVWSLHHWLGHLFLTIYGWPVGLLYIYTIVLGGLTWVWAKCYETYWLSMCVGMGGSWGGEHNSSGVNTMWKYKQTHVLGA